ncbi:hypothetical protein LINPERHAP1_LOCUS19352, partial [Linum perenne]
WDGLFLNQVFSAVDVTIISSIPLPLEPIPDQFIWQLTDSGAYSVHSEYKVAHFGLIKAPVIGPTSPMDSEAWDRIWSFPVPPKLKFFVWKCILGILPNRVALNSRIKDFPRQCPVCTASKETTSHLLLFCPLASRFGTLMNIPLSRINSTNFCIVWRKVLRLDPSVGRRIVFFLVASLEITQHGGLSQQANVAAGSQSPNGTTHGKSRLGVGLGGRPEAP